MITVPPHTEYGDDTYALKPTISDDPDDHAEAILALLDEHPKWRLDTGKNMCRYGDANRWWGHRNNKYVEA